MSPTYEATGNAVKGDCATNPQTRIGTSWNPTGFCYGCGTRHN